MAKSIRFVSRRFFPVMTFFFLVFSSPHSVRAEDPPLGLTPPSAYEEDRNKDLIPEKEVIIGVQRQTLCQSTLCLPVMM